MVWQVQASLAVDPVNVPDLLEQKLPIRWKQNDSPFLFCVC